jgi:hypothetical protein
MTLGAHLERERLVERAARLDRVVTALRARARAYDDEGDGGVDADAVPRPLRRSLHDFQSELDAVRRRLGAS